MSTPTIVLYVDLLRGFQVLQAQFDDAQQEFAAAGIDINTIIFGQATATVSGSSVAIQVLRFPGKSADQVLKVLAIINPLAPDEKLSVETVGGKNVSVVRSDTGYASDWYYGNGDIVWYLNTSSEDEATVALKALP